MRRPPSPAANPRWRQYIDLSGNAISGQGCAAVAEVLGASSSLYSLALADCPVRDDGAVALAEALKSNIGLFKLDLSGTQVRWLVINVGPSGARALGCRLMAPGVCVSIHFCPGPRG